MVGKIKILQGRVKMPFGLGPAGWFLGPYWWYWWFNPWGMGGYWYPYTYWAPWYGYSPYGYAGYGVPGYGYPPSREQERSILEEQRKALEAQLEDVRRRIEELEKAK